MKKEKYLIIDTNVPVKAAKLFPDTEVDRQCSLACFRFVKKLLDSNDTVVIDTGREILREYEKNIDIHAEDNVATEFLKWIYQKRMSGGVSEYQITKNGDTYQEYPDSEDLKNFDRSDRKFVALANAHPAHPCIYNGSDTDWWLFKSALERNGIQIVFLSEDYMKAKSKGCQ